MNIHNYSFVHATRQADLRRQLEDAGFVVWELDIGSVKDSLSFIDVARRELPQDPPLVHGRSLDAFVDSVAGGIDSVSETSNTKKFALLLIHADKLLEATPELLIQICMIFSDVSNRLAQDFDEGGGLVLATFLLGEGPAFRFI